MTFHVGNFADKLKLRISAKQAQPLVPADVAGQLSLPSTLISGWTSGEALRQCPPLLHNSSEFGSYSSVPAKLSAGLILIFQGTWNEWMCASVKGNGRSDLEVSQKSQSKLAIPAPTRLKQDCQKI